jgi:UDP-3-O-acyl N-acetylglucosamine deacetylase
MDDLQSLMDTSAKQRTVAAPAAVEGFGYWQGRDVRVEFRPADAGTGIVFVRSDLEGCPRIAARVENRVETPRRTSLRCGSVGVDMIEHIMAALSGVGVDNCEVWVDAAEMPGCDGSALPFVEAIDAAGIVAQDAPRARQVVRDVLRLENGRGWFEVRPHSPEETLLRYQLDYGEGNSIGRQSFELVLTPDSFRRELAPCRTFMLKSEADWLLSQGLGQRATCRDLLVFGDDGPIDNELRFPDECVRHKLMDMVGDLALAGCQLFGSFSACRSGHRLNAELVGALRTVAEIVIPWRRCA